MKELQDLTTGMGRRRRCDPERRPKVERPLPTRHPDVITRRLSDGTCQVEKYDREGYLVELWKDGVKQPLAAS